MRNYAKICTVAILCCSALLLAGSLFVRHAAAQGTGNAPALPRLVDIGSHSCIPCKMMAPILDELTRDYAGKLVVEFLDTELPQHADAAKRYRVATIPTQIFVDAAGKELWRHEGFISRANILAKWAELGYPFTPVLAAVERWTSVKPDARAKAQVCYMCDGTIPAKSRVTVQTAKGAVHLCSPHCYFIMHSCMTEDKAGIEQRVTVTDARTGTTLPFTAATYLYRLDARTGRPGIEAYATAKSAQRAMQSAGGSPVGWQLLQAKELALRCGFCDRACYQEDASLVKCDGLYSWGCCSHCALGVAARMGKSIEVHERDRLTGAPIIVRVMDGQVAGLEPKTAVAWYGQKKTADGKFVSAGCFHQGFFVTADNLKTWLDQHPTEVGKLITIDQALADKMVLSPVQIQKACKIGECAPK